MNAFALLRYGLGLVAAGLLAACTTMSGSSPQPGYGGALPSAQGPRNSAGPALHSPMQVAYGASAQAQKWPLKVLYAFSGPDGSYPNPVIAGAHGELYGTTNGGGFSACGSGSGCGTVFELTPPSGSQAAWTETVLYKFTNGADGGAPFARLTLGPGGVLYGTTYEGGLASCGFSGSGCGTVFALTPPPSGQTTWTERTLHAFTGGTDGGFSQAALVDRGGSLYGTAGSFGKFNGGTAFRLTPPAHGQTSWKFNVIHAFGRPGDGAYPVATFTQAGNTLLSTTLLGGHKNDGTVFELSPSGMQWKETILQSFNGLNGARPGWERHSAPTAPCMRPPETGGPAAVFSGAALPLS